MQQNKENTIPEAAQNEAYLDGLDTSAEELRELKKKQKSRGTKGDRIYVAVVSVLNIAVLVFIAWHLHSTGNWNNDYEPIRNEAAFDPATAYYNPASALDGELTPAYRGVKFPDGIQDKFRPIYSANQDTAGWIRIDGTGIDFPVMHSEDNLKYERANFYLESDHRGSIWLDFRNTVGVGEGSLSKVSIIYGHHLTTDDYIFAELENYMDVEYYKTHPVIEMDTIYNDYKWKIFACFITNVEPEDDNGHVFYYWDPYITDAEMSSFTGEILSRSWFVNPAVDILPTDKLLCLSTCTYMLNVTKYVETRCVVMARLVRQGESEEVDVSNAYQNESRRMPQLWYTQKGLSNPYATVPVFNEF